MANVKGSAIREIFKMINKPDIISFAGGNPSPDTFPKEEIKEIISDVLTKNPPTPFGCWEIDCIL